MIEYKTDSDIRKIVPPIYKIVPYSLKRPSLTLLSNGFNFYFFNGQLLDLIFFALIVKVGHLFENQKFVASPCYLLLSESSKKYSSSEVEIFLVFLGSEFSASVRTEYVKLIFFIPKSNCEKGLPFIFDFVAYTHFNSDSLNLYKKKQGKNLEYNSLQVSYCSTQLMYKTLFSQKLPIGEVLTKDYIESVKVSHLHSYHNETFCADNIRLFVSGNVDDNLQIFISKIFSSIKLKRPISYPDYFPQHQLPGKLVIKKREDVLQSSILFCRRFNSYHSFGRNNFLLVGILFGGYFGSRLMKNLREKNGYTNGVNTGKIYFASSSIYYMKSEVNVDKTNAAIDEVTYEMNKLYFQYYTEKKLKTVKNYILGELVRDFDVTLSYMNNYFQWNDFGFCESEINEIINPINQITPAMVNDLAQKYLIPKDFSKIIVGNYN